MNIAQPGVQPGRSMAYESRARSGVRRLLNRLRAKQDATLLICHAPSIPPPTALRYEFKAWPKGTHWYHSHSALQFCDGLKGLFIAEDPDDPWRVVAELTSLRDGPTTAGRAVRSTVTSSWRETPHPRACRVTRQLDRGARAYERRAGRERGGSAPTGRILTRASSSSS